MNFAEKLKYERELRGWSQAKMAEELATTPNRISTWERGIALPSAHFRTKLCSLLGTDAQELGLLQPNLSGTSVLDVESLQDTPPPPVAETSPIKKHAFPGLYRRSILIGLLSFVLIGGGSLSIVTLTNWLHSMMANPYSPYAGQLVLNNSLRDQSSGVNWQEGANANQANCILFLTSHSYSLLMRPRSATQTVDCGELTRMGRICTSSSEMPLETLLQLVI